MNITSAADFNPDLPTGQLGLANVSRLHPAQMALGYREVTYRVQQFKAMTTVELDAYLQEHFLPIVIAPNHLPYVVDHHHRARAIQITGLRETVYVKVLENCQNWTEAEFWQLMKQKAWVYLYDKDGKSVEPSAIPNGLAQLQDDKYRSLAWGILQAGGYAKSDVPFQEFLWGNYLRQILPFEDTEAGFNQAVLEALPLCKSPEASHLPGYPKS
ncbi:MAG: hypothetical protein KME35_02220 [Aphanocapsa sp. GSE-SYN-MK-11-07L]|jgi:hypothetical protein|nr:hypothetical protein [Aphanocapsa sp. GSE-SYN-MK-11-07L]